MKASSAPDAPPAADREITSGAPPDSWKSLGAPDLQRPCGFGHGFTYRRESFGGILYHYEGIRPDPHITFVNHGFLIDLLDTLAANPDAPLGDLMDAVGSHCALDSHQWAIVGEFLSTLYRQGALVSA